MRRRLTCSPAWGLGRARNGPRGSTFAPPTDHVRYLREFRVVDPVEVLSAPVEVGERHLTAYHEIRNASDGRIAATVRRRIVCDREWPASFRAPRRGGARGAARGGAAAQRRQARAA